MMPRLFVFTARDSKAKKNLTKTMQNPIKNETTIFGSFAAPYHEELERVREDGRGFYAWGAVPSDPPRLKNQRTWEAMDRGDYVLCAYDNTYHYVARVLSKHDNPQFAEAVWGYDEGRTWQYMYFLLHKVF